MMAEGRAGFKFKYVKGKEYFLPTREPTSNL